MAPANAQALPVLSDAELDRLVEEAQALYRARGRREMDRRQRRRFAFDRAVVLRRVASDNSLGAPYRARARDISLWGLSLCARGKYARHDPLAVDLALTLPTGRERVARLLVDVRHVKRSATGESILGCAFRQTLETTGD